MSAESERDIVLANLGRMDMNLLTKPVKVLCPPEPIRVGEGSSIEEVIRILKEKKIGCVLVTDSSGRLSGIFTERDILTKVILSDLDLAQTSVTRVMTPNPWVGESTTSIALALTEMSDGGFRHLPITDDEGRPEGIISVKDIMDYVSVNLVRSLVEQELSR